MTQLLLESLAVVLNETFGDKYTIYQENVEQGLQEPCFFVQCLETGHTLSRGNRYFRTHEMTIQYLPVSQEKPKEECETVAGQLYQALECLPLHDGKATIRGKRMHHQTIDGVLNFFVEYDCFMKKIIKTETMQTLSVITGGKSHGAGKNSNT